MAIPSEVWSMWSCRAANTATSAAGAFPVGRKSFALMA